VKRQVEFFIEYIFGVGPRTSCTDIRWTLLYTLPAYLLNLKNISYAFNIAAAVF